VALRAMCSDVEMIQKLKEDLLASEKVYSKEAEASRMVEVEELAQSRAGDKMELYTQMPRRGPERAASLAERARGRNVESFLAYAKGWYEREIRGMNAERAARRRRPRPAG
jgi:hypothetical protein